MVTGASTLPRCGSSALTGTEAVACSGLVCGNGSSAEGAELPGDTATELTAPGGLPAPQPSPKHRSNGPQKAMQILAQPARFIAGTLAQAGMGAFGKGP